MGGWGWQELLVILGIVVLIFGGTKLAGLGKASGKAIRDFKDELKGDEKKEYPETPATPADQYQQYPPAPAIPPSPSVPVAPPEAADAVQPGKADAN